MMHTFSSVLGEVLAWLVVLLSGSCWLQAPKTHIFTNHSVTARKQPVGTKGMIIICLLTARWCSKAVLGPVAVKFSMATYLKWKQAIHDFKDLRDQCYNILVQHKWVLCSCRLFTLYGSFVELCILLTLYVLCLPIVRICNLTWGYSEREQSN